MTSNTRNPGTAATVTGVNETTNSDLVGDFMGKFTESQTFWIGLAIGFSIAIAVLPY